MLPGKCIVGIDEVGRGCLAGPVVAAAVIINKPIKGLNDSKKVSKINREKLAKIIYREAVAFGIGWTDVKAINEYGLTFAIANAMEIALAQIKTDYDKIIIDGNYNFLKGRANVETIIKADESIASVSAASIIAKVYRDTWMSKLSSKFPSYGFDRHVGYGTKEHLDMLDKYGPCELHRLFYKPLMKFVN